MRVAYLGNFGPEHSTENHVARAARAVGHDVAEIQENAPGAFAYATALAENHKADVVLWTRTWRLDPDAQRDMLQRCRDADVPTVGYHLDRWWGLNREHEVTDLPFFQCEYVVTADGGHDEQWEQAKVNHIWFPPGVSGVECRRFGERRPDLASKVGFVGAWRGYHEEWPWRRQLVEWLQRTYPDDFRAWPLQPGESIRGKALCDLYRSIDVLVGDSCLAGGATRYWSDRIPETLGRGGFLIHPWVEGIDDHFTDGEHLVLFEVGDFDMLAALIDKYLDAPEERRRIAEAGRAHVLAHHTYERRMAQLEEMLWM